MDSLALFTEGGSSALFQKLDKVRELRNITLVMMKGRSNRFFIPNQLEHYGLIPNCYEQKPRHYEKLALVYTLSKC